MSELTEVKRQDVARSMKEVEASILIAKKFRRDELQSIQLIKNACKRVKLAEKALYAYPRGGQLVTGPSIRLAEVVAQNWGNLDWGIRELESEDGRSLVQAYCWDMENNIRQVKEFWVSHSRWTRKNGNTKLQDPRDIYEMVANQGARRLRACILGVIPLDIIEEAVESVNRTLKGSNDEPIQDRIRKMLDAFNKHQVTKDMIEARVGCNADALNETQLLDLRNIFNSLKDGMSKREDWFEVPKRSEASDTLNNIGSNQEEK